MQEILKTQTTIQTLVDFFCPRWSLSSGGAEHIHTNSSNFSSHYVSSSLHQGLGFSPSSGPGRQPAAASATGVTNAYAMENSSNVLLQATTEVPNRSIPLQQQQPSLWPFSNNDEQTKIIPGSRNSSLHKKRTKGQHHHKMTNKGFMALLTLRSCHQT